LSFPTIRQFFVTAVFAALLTVALAPAAFAGAHSGQSYTGDNMKQHKAYVAKLNKKENKAKNGKKAKDQAAKLAGLNNPLR
jgi:hypothetical protein